MANYTLYNNKFYNSSGQEVTPIGFIGNITYKTYRLTVEPFVLHKVSSPDDVLYCGYTYEDNVSEGDTHLNYFNIVEGTTYPAVAAADFHGMDSQWFVKRDGTWYQYTDPNEDFNPVLDGEGTAVTSSSKINELENIYNEYGETWTDCTLTLKSQYIAANNVILNKSYNFSLYNNLYFGSPAASGFNNSVFRGVSYNNAESVYTATTYNISLPTPDLPLLADQAYKYNDKFYDINYNEITGATEISSTYTNRGIYSKNFQVAATKKVIDGYTLYSNQNNYRLDATKATWSSETETYTYFHSNTPNKDYVYVNNHWMVWNNGSPIEETNANYRQQLSLIDPTSISDTIAKGILTFEILEVEDNQNVFSYDDLGNPSNVAAHTSFSGEVYPLYISTITVAPPITFGHTVKKYVKKNGNLQQTTETIIKTYDTLALANADILNIATNEVIIVKSGIDKSMYRKVNGALTKLFTGSGATPSADQYQIGDIRFVYDRSIVDSDWLLCDGSSFNQVDYPDLYTLLGSTTLPDMTNKCIYHSNNVVALKASAFPGHTHSLKTSSLLHSHDDTTLPSHKHSIYRVYLGQATKGSYQSYTWRWSSTTPQSDGPTVTSTSGNTLTSSAMSGSYGTGSVLHLNEASVWVYIKAR